MLEQKFGFYPTPKSLIREALAPFFAEHGRYGTFFRSHGRFFLDPSAGKGDLLDYLSKECDVPLKHLYAIEIQPELREILAAKMYRVLEADIFDYRGDEYVNFILMNPPFNDGVDHVLQAWKFLADGDLVAILNAETLRNPYTEKRKLLQWMVQTSSSHPPKYIQNAFVDAERRAPVEVVIIWLHKEKKDTLPPFDYTAFDHDRPEKEKDFSASPLANVDYIETLVARYNASIQVVKDIHEREKWYRFYMDGIIDTKADETSAPDTLNDKIIGIKQKYWSHVFNRTNIGKRVTSEYRKKFDAFQKQTEYIGFTVKNIQEVLEMFILNAGDIMKACILQVFDEATAFHEKNKVHTEGWKTNKSYRVNRKIIMPRGLTYDDVFRFSLRYADTDFYNDMDRVLCFLSGKKYEDIKPIVRAMEDHFSKYDQMYWNGLREEWSYQDPFTSEFFQIRIFKKGTVHLTFIDEDLWQELNVQAARGKGWLGGGY